MKIIDKRIEEIYPYQRNPRRNDGAVDAVASSIKEFGFKVPVVIDKGGVIVAGHTRVKAAKKLGLRTVPCIVADDLTEEQVKAFRLADNRVSELADWDFDLLKLELDDLSFDMTLFEFPDLDDDDIDMNNLSERVGEKDEAYNEFVDKFKTKATTDDCFTPPEVYEVIKEWVLERYDIDEGREIVRPFYPGGDYRNYEYPPNCIVIDNPPFSIMSEITNWYCQNGIDFFLFANHMTLFSSLKDCNVVVVGANVVYENGAEISTSFVTNMGEFRISVASSLYDAIDQAQPKDVADLNAYEYPDNVISGPRIANLAKYGIDFDIRECVPVSKLDDGTGLFGKGALISDYEAEKLKAEKLKAEKLKAEKLKAEKQKIKVILSEREREIIEGLNERFLKSRTPMDALGKKVD